MKQRREKLLADFDKEKEIKQKTNFSKEVRGCVDGDLDGFVFLGYLFVLGLIMLFAFFN